MRSHRPIEMFEVADKAESPLPNPSLSKPKPIAKFKSRQRQTDSPAPAPVSVSPATQHQSAGLRESLPDADAPLNEVPRDRVSLFLEGVRASDIHGQTLRNNGPPDASVALEEERARVSAIAQGWSDEISADIRAETGNVDPRLVALRTAFSKAVTTSDDIATMPVAIVQQLGASYQAGAERYGKRGSAFEDPVSRTPDPRVATELSKAQRSGNAQADDSANIFQAGAAFQDFGSGRSGIELYAEVELTHDTDGRITSRSWVLPSGDPRFDSWIDERLQEVIQQLNAGVTRSALSRWGFKGRVSYMRKTTDIDLKKDALYFLAQGFVSAFTRLPTGGRFDEVSGTSEYVDLRHPHFECQVKLVRERKIR
jgi:hypothetical protein